MWLSKRLSDPPIQESILRGRVTASGQRCAISADGGELRGIETFAPGGLRWTPKSGYDLLVIKTSDGPVAIGAPQSTPCDTLSLAAGLVTLSGDQIVICSPTSRITADNTGITMNCGGTTLSIAPGGAYINGKRIKTEEE